MPTPQRNNNFVFYPNCSLPKIDIVNKKFGKLRVESFYGRRRGIPHFSVLCECGNTSIVGYYKLIAGRTISCGCYKREYGHSRLENLVGKTFGRLSVLRWSHVKNKNNFWLCECRCGRTTKVSSNHLTTHRIRSCGCLKKEMLSKKSGKKNHLWRGGKSTPYPKEWNYDLKELIRNRDRRNCQYPRCTYNDSVNKNKKLDVHHINGDKSNCLSYNLVSLCHGHHMTVEAGSENWEDYFYEITRSYE